MKTDLSERMTIPTDVDVVPGTFELLKRWGADTIRDCGGTNHSEELENVDTRVYSTYYTTRKDNAWAKTNPDEIQQMYIMAPLYTAVRNEFSTHLMNHLHTDLLKVNNRDSIERWWEVIDRTIGQPVPVSSWEYDSQTGNMIIREADGFHEHTVSSLIYIVWDPVHMYNAVINGWTDSEKQTTFNMRQPKTRKFSMDRLREYFEDNPHVDMIHYTTFFHRSTLIFDELAREKYVDWYGYSAPVGLYILEQSEKEVEYPFHPECIIDQGYMNNTYQIPSKELLDFQAFQRHEMAKLAKEMVDITHEYDKEAMMFLGDHWVGTKPFMDEFKTIGLDAVVGSAGDGCTPRLISDTEGANYTEGRFLPYFFPDTSRKGRDPVRLVKVNQVTVRRTILRKPIDRIGYDDYLKLVLQFPEFIGYVEDVCNEFRTPYDNIKGVIPCCIKTMIVLSCWGEARAWGNHMVHHAIYHKQNHSYTGIIEALSSAPFDVKFTSLDDVRNNSEMLKDIDVILNVGDADTVYTGRDDWCDETVAVVIRKSIYSGGGSTGVGEPAAHQHKGHFFQLAAAMGVEKETGSTFNVDRYNWEQHDHFIREDYIGEIDLGEGKKNIYAFDGVQILVEEEKEVQVAASEFGEGRCIYISELPYSFENSRILYRSTIWSSHNKENLYHWFSSNFNVGVHVYVKNGKYCAVSNTYELQYTTIYKGDRSSFEPDLKANEIVWYEIQRIIKEI